VSACQTCHSAVRHVRAATCMPDVSRIPFLLHVIGCRWPPKLAAEVFQTRAGHAGPWQRGSPQQLGGERLRPAFRRILIVGQTDRAKHQAHEAQKTQAHEALLFRVPLRSSSVFFVVLPCPPLSSVVLRLGKRSPKWAEHEKPEKHTHPRRGVSSASFGPAKKVCIVVLRECDSVRFRFHASCIVVLP
jgi:hypothetical protein